MKSHTIIVILSCYLRKNCKTNATQKKKKKKKKNARVILIFFHITLKQNRDLANESIRSTNRIRLELPITTTG